MGSVNYFNEDITFDLPHAPSITEWVQHIITLESQTPGELNFIFCSDEYLLQLNRQYLSHDYYTDIITFDHEEETDDISGDIFISIDRVRENAQERNLSFTQELHRVMIHGILHLLGYKDKTTSDQLRMRSKEDASISLLKI